MAKQKKADTPSVEQIRDAAREIWLAGLAAFTQAQKQGSDLYDSLRKEGEKVESRVRKLAEDSSRKARSAAENLEQGFETRLAETLNRLGVPSRTDLGQLQERLEEMENLLKQIRKKTR